MSNPKTNLMHNPSDDEKTLTLAIILIQTLSQTLTIPLTIIISLTLILT